MNKKQIIFVFLIFTIISILFFYKGFIGYTIQGIDENIGTVKTISQQIKHTIEFLLDEWLVKEQGNFRINIRNLMHLILPIQYITTMSNLLSILLSLIFSFLLLINLKLSVPASIFGALAYSFTPHFITAIYSGHGLVIDMLPFPPFILYFINLTFKSEDKSVIKKFFYTLLCGIGWGIMLSDDIQRGLYFSILFAIYIIFLLIKDLNIQNLKSFKLQKEHWVKIGYHSFFTFLIFVFMLLSFANGLQAWIEPLKQRTALQDTKTLAKSEEEKWSFSTSWSFSPKEFIDSFAFGYHGTITGDPDKPYWGEKEFSGNSEAIGYFVILFTIIGIIFLRKNPYVLFFFISGIIALLLSFGKFWPGKPLFWIFYKLPLMSNFRAPAKFISIVAFCFSIISAFGFDFIINKIINSKDEERNKFIFNLIKGIGIFLIFGILWLLFILITSSSLSFDIGQKLKNMNLGSIAVKNTIFSLLRMNIFSLLSIGLFYFIYSFYYKERKSLILMNIAFILLLIYDLWSIDLYFVNKSYIKIDEFYKKDGVVSYIESEYQNEIFRVTTSLMIPYNGQAHPYPITGLKQFYMTYTFPYFGIQSMDITASSTLDVEYNNFFMRTLEGSINKKIETIDDLIDINLRLMRLANVKYFLFDIEVKNSNIILNNILDGLYGRKLYLYYLPDYLSRASFYENYIQIENNNEILNYIKNPYFDINNLVVINNKNYERVLNTNNFIPLKIIDYKSWHYKIELSEKKDGFVVLNVKYSPKWKAYLDGVKVPIYRANYLLFGTYVNSTNKILEFKHEPDKAPFLISLRTTVLGLFVSIIFFIINYFSNKFKIRNL